MHSLKLFKSISVLDKWPENRLRGQLAFRRSGWDLQQDTWRDAKLFLQMESSHGKSERLAIAVEPARWGLPQGVTSTARTVV
jgi:hypothetical protein